MAGDTESRVHRRIDHRSPFGSEESLRLPWPVAAGCLTWFVAVFSGVFLLESDSLRLLWFHAGVLAGVLLLGFARRWDRRALGLVSHPRPSVSYWIYASGWGLLVCVLAFVFAIALSRRGTDPFGFCGPALPSTNGSVLSYVLRPAIEEELLFRFLPCGALLGYVSVRANVAINGVIFALMHIVFGGIGPDSAVAGFVLAWAFLRSGSILVPIAMHAAGNGLLFVVYRAEFFRTLACGG